MQLFRRLVYQYYSTFQGGGGDAVSLWLNHCATNWKVAGSVLDGDIGIFH
jgi:hypothetical protein